MIRRLGKLIKMLLGRGLLYAFIAFGCFATWSALFPAPPTIYALSEWRRTGEFKRDWIDTSALPRHVYASLIASEDAGFCDHHGVEWGALRAAIAGETRGGGSTISQQMVKNLFLWHGNSRLSKVLRKGVEIPMTLIIELIYSKERILEIYLNIVEFDTSVFGIEEAAQHHFHVPASQLTPHQMALLTAVLPNPKAYSVIPLDAYVDKRARQIETGAGDVIARNLDDCVR